MAEEDFEEMIMDREETSSIEDMEKEEYSDPASGQIVSFIKERYSKAVAKMKNDPKKIKTMVNKATTHLQKMLKEVLEAKSPAIKKAIKRYKKEYGASYFSDRQYRAASDIASRSENLFRDYSTYLQEANRSAMMRSDEYVNRYAETVVNDCRNIMKLKAVDYL